ncbi:MAG: hypothetical protein ACO3UU_05190 [Minisyncoccia bacterium]
MSEQELKLKVPKTNNPRELERWRVTLEKYLRDLSVLSNNLAVIKWDSLSKIGSDIADLETKSHTSLTDIGSNTHAQIDSHIVAALAHIAATSAHGVSGAIVGTTDGQTLTNKTIDAGSNTILHIPTTLKSDTTQTGNVGTGEDNLIAYSLPANTLDTDGDFIEITAFGTMAVNANNKTLKLYFGSTVIYNSGASAVNGASWNLNATIVRTSATTQKCIVSMLSEDTTLIDSAEYNTAAESLSGSVTIKCTGEATNDNDIVQESLIVKWWPNA